MLFSWRVVENGNNLYYDVTTCLWSWRHIRITYVSICRFQIWHHWNLAFSTLKKICFGCILTSVYQIINYFAFN
jgi:hypothetical protein